MNEVDKQQDIDKLRVTIRKHELEQLECKAKGLGLTVIRVHYHAPWESSPRAHPPHHEIDFEIAGADGIVGVFYNYSEAFAFLDGWKHCFTANVDATMAAGEVF